MCPHKGYKSEIQHPCTVILVAHNCPWKRTQDGVGGQLHSRDQQEKKQPLHHSCVRCITVHVYNAARYGSNQAAVLRGGWTRLRTAQQPRPRTRYWTGFPYIADKQLPCSVAASSAKS